ncbi:unnamed protein product [Absidia cylindrospora]
MLQRYDQIKDLDLTLEQSIVDHKIRELEEARDLTQAICHLDMDAFYASVEELDDPSLKDVPMAVGGMSMLCTSNYLARKSGVRSGMPGFIAIKLCPSLKMIPLHFPKYRAASAKVRDVFKKYDPDFLPMSLDEAYLNLTKYLTTTDLSPAEVVKQIRNEIFENTKLTASAGIAANRMIAKVCSDINKPNGQYFLPSEPEAIMEFTKNLSIRKVPGVGRVTQRVLEALGVKTCGDIYGRRALLYRLLSPISFNFMLKSYLGLGSTSLVTESSRKSMSVERTFSPITNRTALRQKVDQLSELLAQDLAKDGLRGKTVSIKLKLTSFTVRARAKTFPSYISSSKDIARIAKDLLEKELPVNIRLMGIRMSTLKPQANEDQGVKKYFSVVTNKIVNDSDGNSNNYTPMKRPHPDDMESGTTNDTSAATDIEMEGTSSQPLLMDLICPICNRQLQMDNSQFNYHVDECLTKVTVKAILQEQDHQGMEVRGSGEDSNSSSSSENTHTSNHSRKRTGTPNRQLRDKARIKSLLDYYS